MSSSIGSKSFVQYYETYCKARKIRPKAHILKNKKLKINADGLVSDEWNPIIKALKGSSNDFHLISLFSNYLRQNSKYLGRSRTNLIPEPDFFKENLLKSLIGAVCKCVVNTNIVTSLSFEGFPLEGHVQLLIDCFRQQKNLQHISLPHCVLREDEVTGICKAITLHTGLKTIDLTGCGLTINSAKEIAAVIRTQKLARYGETWKQSLRYRTPDPEVVPGICRFTLNDNDGIGDEGFRCICYELFDDMWVKAVDFQNCAITDASSEFALDLIKTNPNLQILDLRKNFVASQVTKYIWELLEKDCEDKEYEWLSSANHSQSFSSTDRIKENYLPSRRFSATSNRTQKQTRFQENEEDDDVASRLTQIANTDKDFPIISNNKNHKGSNVSGELERTKSILHKVASKLFEERSKREVLEKQRKEYKEQLGSIRQCLENQIKSAQESKSNTRTQNSKISLCRVKCLKRHGIKMKKSNCSILSKSCTVPDCNKYKRRHDREDTYENLARISKAVKQLIKE